MSLPALLAVSFLPGGSEWIVLLVLGLLIFGRRLPEVGRSLGKGIVEFKKGIKGIEDGIEEASSDPARMTNQAAGGGQLPVQGGEDVSTTGAEAIHDAASTTPREGATNG